MCAGISFLKRVVSVYQAGVFTRGMFFDCPSLLQYFVVFDECINVQCCVFFSAWVTHWKKLIVSEHPFSSLLSLVSSSSSSSSSSSPSLLLLSSALWCSFLYSLLSSHFCRRSVSMISSSLSVPSVQQNPPLAPSGRCPSARSAQCWVRILVPWRNSCWNSLHCYEDFFVCVATKIFPDKLSVLRNVRSSFSSSTFFFVTSKIVDVVVKVVSVLGALKRRISDLFRWRKFSSTSHWCFGICGDTWRVDMDFWMTSSSVTPLRVYGSRVACLQSVVDTLAHTFCMFILAMLAATVVVPCLSGHIRAPGQFWVRRCCWRSWACSFAVLLCFCVVFVLLRYFDRYTGMMFGAVLAVPDPVGCARGRQELGEGTRLPRGATERDSWTTNVLVSFSWLRAQQLSSFAFRCNGGEHRSGWWWRRGWGWRPPSPVARCWRQLWRQQIQHTGATVCHDSAHWFIATCCWGVISLVCRERDRCKILRRALPVHQRVAKHHHGPHREQLLGSVRRDISGGTWRLPRFEFVHAREFQVEAVWSERPQCGEASLVPLPEDAYGRSVALQTVWLGHRVPWTHDLSRRFRWSDCETRCSREREHRVPRCFTFGENSRRKRPTRFHVGEGPCGLQESTQAPRISDSVEECQSRWYPCQRTWTLRMIIMNFFSFWRKFLQNTQSWHRRS